MEQQGSLRWWVLITVIIGTFLGRLDQTIVNLAVPKIISDFSITVTAAGWIATAYILANAVFVPIWGKLGDTLGRKKIYILGFSLFIFGSVLAGLAWNLPSLIVFRVIQAIAGSADYPTAMAIIAVTFREGKERAQALGIWSSSFAAAAVFGPLIGGPLIDNFGWRSVFLVNLPVGLLGLFMALRYVHESKSDQKNVSFDWWGAITLGGALSALVLVLDQGSTWGWLSFSSMLCYIATVAFTWTFIFIERHVKEPIVDLNFFKMPAFVNTLGNNFIVFMGMMGSLFLVPVFAQTFLGYNATQSGYLFIPMAAALLLASPLGGSLIGKVKAKYVIFTSTIVAAFGISLFSLIDPKSSALALMLPLAVMAFGLGFGMAQRTNVIASIVKREEIGVASSILALGRNIAGAFGIALFGTILTDRIKSNVLAVNGMSVLRKFDPATVRKFITLVELKAQVDAYRFVFIVSAIIVFVGSFTILFLKLKHEDTKTQVHVE
ncbi:MAG: DHA2 family efflux MFS transporter permease subunit [Patescibacteria group bacterium]|nr:DHA2 family efflux MFS transporter permease subunit [Patescibacteria group bacterium]MDE1945587.1 DHA2 family efflux MFS transporter permease subunit [Patescibacteria group bacterium]